MKKEKVKEDDLLMKRFKISQISKQLRTAKNMTQDDLVGVLNVSRSTIAGYETQNNLPDYDKLVQIASFYSFYKVTIDYLLFQRDKKSIKH